MTKDQVQALPDFDSLQDDSRFRALMSHLRSVTPAGGSESGDWFRGRLSVMEQIGSLWGKPPADPMEPTPRRQQYKTYETPKHTAT